jgi:hypothetical protein
MSLEGLAGLFLSVILVVFIGMVAIGVWKQFHDPESEHFNHDPMKLPTSIEARAEFAAYIKQLDMDREDNEPLGEYTDQH